MGKECSIHEKGECLQSLIKKTSRSRPLRRPRDRWKDNIKNIFRRNRMGDVGQSQPPLESD